MVRVSKSSIFCLFDYILIHILVKNNEKRSYIIYLFSSELCKAILLRYPNFVKGFHQGTTG